VRWAAEDSWASVEEKKKKKWVAGKKKRGGKDGPRVDRFGLFFLFF
jgi:hypothetical protein